MNFSVPVVAVFYLLANLGFVNSESTVKTKLIEQKLDNFDEKNNKTWNMRYMVTEKYFKEGGPMFLYIGSANPIEPGYIEYGLLSDLAREHNGILFHTEHRYYGESRPTSDLSLENLKYLSAQQALADLAHFIRHQRKTDPRLAKSKVFISGCSYGGSLAVWFNILYPKLVDGTWSISGPILAKVNFREYYEIVGAAVKELGSRRCYDRIQNGIDKLNEMFSSSDADADRAKKVLNICKYNFNARNKLDLWAIFREISSLFAHTVVFPKAQNIASRCDLLMKERDDLTAIANFYQERYSKHECVNRNYYLDNYYFKNIKYVPNKNRAWLYQTCNEFGWFQTSASTKQPFGNKHPLSGDLQLCSEVFGDKYTKKHIHQSIEKTNKLFGGLFPNVKNVYMTHCSLDPWSALRPFSNKYVSIVPKCFHCAHIYSISNNDTDEMLASKQYLFELAHKWLS